jgi:exodeoxyribonuclease V gamma subunit
MVKTFGAGLTVSYVTNLSQIVQPVVKYLKSSPDNRDIFASDTIIVPNAGVRAWLLQQIASTVGVTPGEEDGISANIKIDYVGMIRQIAGHERLENDPWEIEPLTIAVLDCLEGFPEAPALALRYGGMLRAARAIADTFDVYHARRPQMIDAWEKGFSALAPVLGNKIANSEWEIIEPALDNQDLWQFHLWTKVRAHIGTPSPPAQVNELVNGLIDGSKTPNAERLLVVGLQALDSRTIQLVQALSRHILVEVVLVHPSPALAQKWQPEALAMNGAIGATPIRPKDAAVEDGVHSLLSTWLQGSREAQLILGTFGVQPSFIENSEVTPNRNRLQHLQQCVLLQPHVPAQQVPEKDFSLQIHRAHELTRQVEILHDALLHAFDELPDLEPHQIVILCADMTTSAPILRSIFDREVQVLDKNGASRSVTIPLVVADRGLREVSEGARLLSAVLEAMGSRASRTSVMNVLAVDAVLSNLSLGREVIDIWNQLLDRTGMKWGLDSSQRAQQGFAATAGETYTWLSTVQQSLLGVFLPDAKPVAELGGVIPLDDLDTADVDAVVALSYLLSLLMNCEVQTRKQRSVAEWCLLLEELLVELCGMESDVLVEPLAVLRSLRVSSELVGGGSKTAVSFDEFTSIVIERVEATPGRQPLRTGAVTATSFVPLRSVPFRVVCILGYDDAVVSVKEVEGDDLTGRQRFIGTPDSRIETRRTFLDAMLAASDRFIVTCIGKSIKNNTLVPFTTPLAEFVDMCLDADSSAEEPKEKLQEKLDRFIFDHPRHAMSSNNFIPDKVVPGMVWGHNSASFTAGSVVGMTNASQISTVTPFSVEQPDFVTIDDLIRVLEYPEDFFLNTVGVSKWVDKVQADTALLPTDTDARRLRELWNELRDLSDSTSPSSNRSSKKFNSDETSSWKSLKKERGAVPVGILGDDVLNDVETLLRDTEALVEQWGFPDMAEAKREITLHLPNGVIEGDISFFETDKLAGFASLYGVEHLQKRAAILLLLLAAQGTIKHSAIVFGYDKKTNKIKVNNVFFEPELTQGDAIRRLAGLIDAIHIARTIPAVKFGGTAKAITTDEGSVGKEISHQDVFDKFVTSDDYGKLLERRLFGEEPKFSEVFATGGPMRNFWLSLTSAINGPTNKKGIRKHAVTNIKVSDYVVK